jgi:hypothetical protein
VDLERFPRQRALHEPWDDVPVAAVLPRPDCVEEARDHAAQSSLVAQREREELVERLRVGVGPALRGRRPVDPLRVLIEQDVLRVIAVDLGAGRDQHRLLESCAVVEHVLGALHVRQQRTAGLLDDQADADGRGQVVHDVTAVHELADDGLREHRVDDEMEALAVAELRDVRLLACREVVEGEDLEPFVEQELRQVRADEAGPAGDQSPHVPSRLTASVGRKRLLVKPL